MEKEKNLKSERRISRGSWIKIHVSEKDKYAVVSISDTGCGMAKETQQNIFKKFYQGDTSHATAGNGLGLALVKRIVDIHGGSIKVSSRIGEGSSFTVKLAKG